MINSTLSSTNLTKRCLHCGHTFQHQLWDCPACQFTPETWNGFAMFAPEMAHSTDMYLAEYFARLCEIEPSHFWFEYRNTLIIRMIRRYFPDVDKFLEVGCGTGFALSGIQQAFPTMQVVGTDLLVEALDFAQQRVPQAVLLQMDARYNIFQETFGLLGSFDMLEHIDEDTQVIQQMYAALRPGGGLLLTVPQHPSLWSIIDEHAMHRRRYTRQELITKVQQAGFEVLYVTSFISLLLPLMYASRLQYTFNRKPVTDGLAHLNVSPTLNRLFASLLSIEARMINTLSLPAGGSLLLVARKPAAAPHQSAQ